MKCRYMLLFLLSVAPYINVAAEEAANLQIHLNPEVSYKANIKEVLKATAMHSLCGTFIASISSLPVFIVALPFLANANDIQFAARATLMCAGITASLVLGAYYFKHFEIDLSQEEFNARIDVAAQDLAHKRTAKECRDRSLLIKEAQCSADATSRPVHVVVEPVNTHPTAQERQEAFECMSNYVQSMPARFYGLCCSIAIAAAAVKYAYFG